MPRSAASFELVIDADAPGAVVGREGEDRDGSVVLQQPAEGRRDRSVCRPEVTAVVDEAAVLDHLVRARRTGVAQPRGHRDRRPPGIDDEIGRDLLAVLGADAGDVDDAVGARWPSARLPRRRRGGW